MAHPYRSAGRTGAKLKFRAMLGSDAGAKHFNDDSVVNGTTPVKNGVEDVKIMGHKPSPRLDRARGGKVAKKGGTTVNVIVPPSQGAGPMPPPGAGPGGPPMLPPGLKPPMSMGPPSNGPMPGAGLPMRARGGRAHSDEAEDKVLIRKMIKEEDAKEKARGGSISGTAKPNQLKQWAQYSRKNSYQKKAGGGLSKAKLTGGADSGVGRLEHSKAQGKHKSS